MSSIAYYVTLSLLCMYHKQHTYHTGKLWHVDPGRLKTHDHPLQSAAAAGSASLVCGRWLLRTAALSL